MTDPLDLDARERKWRRVHGETSSIMDPAYMTEQDADEVLALIAHLREALARVASCNVVAHQLRQRADELEVRADQAEAEVARLTEERDALQRQVTQGMSELAAGVLARAERAEAERDALRVAGRAFIDAWEKSHQLEKTDVAVRLMRAALARTDAPKEQA